MIDMKKKRMSKETKRKGLLSFCITLIVLALFTGSVVAIYNTASVIYGEDQVANVQKNETSYEFTLFSQKQTLSASGVEKAVAEIAGYSPWLPAEIRAFFITAGGIWEAAQESVTLWLGR